MKNNSDNELIISGKLRKQMKYTCNGLIVVRLYNHNEKLAAFTAHSICNGESQWAVELFPKGGFFPILFSSYPPL